MLNAFHYTNTKSVSPAMVSRVTRATKSKIIYAFFSAALFLVLCGITLGAWWIIVREEARDIRNDTALTVEQTAIRLESSISSRLHILEMLQGRWRDGRLNGRADFVAESKVLQKRFPGLMATNWIDIRGVVRWVVPEKKIGSAMGTNVRQHRIPAEVLASVERMHAPQLTPFFDFAHGGKGFVAYYPVNRNGKFEGIIAGLFDSERLIRSILSKGILGKYSFTVSDGKTVLKSNDKVPLESAYAASAEVKVLDRRWTITLSPTADLLASGISGFAWLFFTIAIFLSGALSWLFWLNLMRQKGLRESEEKARAFLNATSDSAILFDTNYEIADLNEAMAAQFGKSREEMIGSSTIDLFPPGLAAKRKARFERIIRTGKPVHALDEREGRLLESQEYPVFDHTGKVAWIAVFARDVTTQRKALEQLKTTQTRLVDAINSISGSVDLYDAQDRLVLSNAGNRKLGPDVEEILKPGRTFESILRMTVDQGRIAEAMDNPEEWIKARMERHRKREGSTEYLLLNGDWMLLTEYRTHDGGTLIIRTDITEKKQAEKKLKASLEEKEVLLQEVHHRVKNNFQLIASMLGFQAETMKDRKAGKELKQARHRIIAMARVHEKLYSATDLAHVEARDYLENIVTDLIPSDKDNHPEISYTLEIDPITLEGEQAIACGLIVNELVSNALKHGFPKGRSGSVEISMHRRDGGLLELAVADDGVGLPEDFKMETSETLGMKLVSAFAMQLGGEVTVKSNSLTRFQIVFEEKS